MSNAEFMGLLGVDSKFDLVALRLVFNPVWARISFAKPNQEAIPEFEALKMPLSSLETSSRIFLAASTV